MQCVHSVQAYDAWFFIRSRPDDVHFTLFATKSMGMGNMIVEFFSADI